MVNASKVENLVKKMATVMEDEIKKQNVTIDEFLNVVGRFVAHGSKTIADGSNSLDILQDNEKKIDCFFGQVIHPFFMERKKQLLSKEPTIKVTNAYSDPIRSMIPIQSGNSF